MHKSNRFYAAKRCKPYPDHCKTDKMIEKLIKIFIITLSCISCKKENTELSYTFSTQRTYSTHREVDISWKNEGVNLSGTLYLPLDSGLYTTAAWMHGSSINLRRPYKDDCFYLVRHGSACSWVDRGYAFFSYDKRGSGESEGTYTTQVTENYLKLLGRDALSAIKVCSKYPEIDKNKIGFFGESQAGWTITTIEDNNIVKFSIIINGPAVSYGEFEYYASLTGNNDTKFQYTDCNNINLDSIYNLLYDNRNENVSGYDPEQGLIQMQQPSLFIIGLRDLHVPARLDLEDLTDIKENYNKNWEIITIENADHALMTNNALCITLTQPEGSLIQELHYQVDWETPAFSWLNSIENE